MYKCLSSVILTFTLAILLCGCYTTRKVIVQTYNYDNDITFTVDSVQEGSQIATGNGSYYAKKGFKLVMVFVSLKNHSNEKKKLDFENFYLLEPKSHTKYKVEFVMLQTAMNIWGSADIEIQKNDTKKRKLVFLFPKIEQAEMFSVNDIVNNIKYLPVTK